MDKINKDFNVPFYIFEEIVQYIELTAQGNCKTAKWNNIKSLLKLAQVNNRLSSEQVNFLIETYCRE
ncbi:MAG: hypothetical protein HFJ29_00835 [Clostridia bacterium]|nr:hypothetical protein [Clostridia bacterium]